MDDEQFRLTTSPVSGIRASDADRERMLELRRAHHLEGRLDASEFQERLGFWRDGGWYRRAVIGAQHGRMWR